MISAIQLVSLKGDVLLSRYYRNDVSRSTTSAFRRDVIAAANFDKPIVIMDQNTFLYHRERNVFLVAVTRRNANPAVAFQYMYNLVEVFKDYFQGRFNEAEIRSNFELIHELLDETMDNGYPQITASAVLKKYITSKELKSGFSRRPAASTSVTSEITGKVDWRTGDHFYKKNEVFIDVLESVNLLMSNQSVLRSDVSGKVVMKTYLSGTPECKFGMNDKILMEKEKNEKKQTGRQRQRRSGIAIDDFTFHRCVKLFDFEKDRTINFVPPDGEFTLMNYRITKNVNLPFRVIPVVTDHGRNRVTYDIEVKGNFKGSSSQNELSATAVVLKIPTPKNTSNCNFQVITHGKAKYVPGQNAIFWRMKKFHGNQKVVFKAEVKVISSTNDSAWSRPPITMEFQVPYFTASGLHVRYLKVFETANYNTVRWVRYMTRAGVYQIRI